MKNMETRKDNPVKNTAECIYPHQPEVDVTVLGLAPCRQAGQLVGFRYKAWLCPCHLGPLLPFPGWPVGSRGLAGLRCPGCTVNL